VTEQAGPGFGGRLWQLRDEAVLTQDELAETAQVSQRAVSDLERGINSTARKDTATLLAGALGLHGQARAVRRGGRGRVPAGDVLAAQGKPRGAFAAAATRALPRDTAAFTGIFIRCRIKPSRPLLPRCVERHPAISLRPPGSASAARCGSPGCGGLEGLQRAMSFAAPLGLSPMNPLSALEESVMTSTYRRQACGFFSRPVASPTRASAMR